MSKDLLIGLCHIKQLPAPATADEEDRLSYNGLTRLDVVRFAKWNPSKAGLDLVARRFTSGVCDWNALRTDLLLEQDPASEARLAMFTTEHLMMLLDALSSAPDSEVEAAVARRIAYRHVNGDRLSEENLPQLASTLLRFDCVEHAGSIAVDLAPGSWSRIVVEAELAHPRFGGTHDGLLEKLNEAYRAAGMVEVCLLDGDGSPFSRLTAASDRKARGPLVSVIMSAWRPGEEIFTAVRSVIDQTYQDWELIVTDDASGADYDDVFSKLEAIDPRVQVIRNDVNAGTYVRRNEALSIASGEYVTFHDSDDWSHPQRIEMQAQDLEAHPGRIGNIVRHARATEELSFATNRGTALTLTEPAIMFRRERALSSAGFYDGIRKGADREYRLRLEIVTGSTVKLIGPMAPVQLMLASSTSLSGSDFGPGWMTSARVAYRAAVDRYHDLVRSKFAEGRIALEDTSRRFVAPPDLLHPGGARETRVRVDVLVIIDGQSRRGREAFLRQVSLEMREAASAGLSIGLLHSDSLGIRRGGPRLSSLLQTLVDEHVVYQVFEDQPVDTPLVVIRHASAVQAHSTARRPIETSRAVIVEDPSGGDVRQITFTVTDVQSTVAAWLGVEPSWGSISELSRFATLSRRATLCPQVLATFSAPGAQMKYEDQLVTNAGREFDVRFQRAFRSALGTDLVYGVGALDAYLGLNADSPAARRLERTKRFVDDLKESRAGLVRVLIASPEPVSDQRLQEAQVLLDDATTRFIVNDLTVDTPDPSRTVRIPSADLSSLLSGYPTRTREPGRLLSLSRSGSNAFAISALRTFFVSRTPGLSLRVVAPADATLLVECARAMERTPRQVSQRLGMLSDAALVEEITGAELVMVPDVRSPDAYQLAMMCLALRTPVLTPSNPTAESMCEAVGDNWVIPLSDPLTAERVDNAVHRAREHPEDASPNLSGRDFNYIGAEYAHVLLDAAREIRRTIFGTAEDGRKSPAANEMNWVEA